MTLNLLSALTMTSFSNGHHSSVLVVIEGAWQVNAITPYLVMLLIIVHCSAYTNSYIHVKLPVFLNATTAV